VQTVTLLSRHVASSNSNDSRSKTYRCSAQKVKASCESRLAAGAGDAFTLHDITGRLSHDLNRPADAISPYTSALQINPKVSASSDLQ
jgi:hypothetical protein